MGTIAVLRRTLSRAASLAVFALAAGTWAGASDAAQTPGRGPCTDDIAKFCRDTQPGGGRIVRCLKQHEQELSPACKQHAAEVKKKGQEFRAACEDDVLRLCGNVRTGGGRILQCLKQHERELTPDCTAKMQQTQPRGK